MDVPTTLSSVYDTFHSEGHVVTTSLSLYPSSSLDLGGLWEEENLPADGVLGGCAGGPEPASGVETFASADNGTKGPTPSVDGFRGCVPEQASSHPLSSVPTICDDDHVTKLWPSPSSTRQQLDPTPIAAAAAGHDTSQPQLPGAGPLPSPLPFPRPPPAPSAAFTPEVHGRPDVSCLGAGSAADVRVCGSSCYSRMDGGAGDVFSGGICDYSSSSSSYEGGGSRRSSSSSVPYAGAVPQPGLEHNAQLWCLQEQQQQQQQPLLQLSGAAASPSASTLPLSDGWPGAEGRGFPLGGGGEAAAAAAATAAAAAALAASPGGGSWVLTLTWNPGVPAPPDGSSSVQLFHSHGQQGPYMQSPPLPPPLPPPPASQSFQPVLGYNPTAADAVLRAPESLAGQPLAAKPPLAERLGLSVDGKQRKSVVTAVGRALFAYGAGAQPEGPLHAAWFEAPQGCRQHAFFARGKVEGELTDMNGITSGRIPVRLTGFEVAAADGTAAAVYVISVSGDRCTCGGTYNGRCKRAGHFAWKVMRFQLAYEKPPRGAPDHRGAMESFDGGKKDGADTTVRLWVP